MATRANLEIAQGTTQNIEIPDVKDSAGSLINPAGLNARSQIRATEDSASFLYEWTSPGTITITVGNVTLHLTPAVTSAWTFANGYLDVELFDGSGQVSKIGDAYITVNREIMR